MATTHRTGIINAFIAVAGIAATSAWAAPETATTGAEVPQTMEQANAQRERAKAMKQAAEEQLSTEQNACYQKILVSACLKDAKARYTASIVEARKLDIPARDFQRDTKRTEADVKEAKRAADMPQREVDQRAQAAQYHEKEAERATAREQKIAGKAEQSAQYRKKAAAQEKARSERLAERERREAKRAADQAKREAKLDAAAQARLPKP